MGDINRQGDIEVNIVDKTNQYPVGVTSDGKLKVDAVISVNDAPTKYQLRSSYDSTGVSVGTSDTTLYSYTGAGVVDFIAISNDTSSQYEVVIKIDDVERIRISMPELGSNLRLTGSPATPIWVDTANKNFRYSPNSELGFSTKFEIIAKSLSGTQTLTYLTLYREHA